MLAAIYAAFGAGWDDVAGADRTVRGLTEEAIYLARLIVDLAPEEPEARGLLALMLYCEARRDARRDAEGRFVPLSRQDARLWSRDMIIEAEGLLSTASRHGRFGHFQCEAAIQSVHVHRPITGRTNMAALRTLYDLLAAHHPGVGVLVARAAMLAEAGDPAAALEALAELPAERAAAYQPYWAARAHALRLVGRGAEAVAAYDRAIGLSEDEGVRAFLRAGSRAARQAC